MMQQHQANEGWASSECIKRSLVLRTTGRHVNPASAVLLQCPANQSTDIGIQTIVAHGHSGLGATRYIHFQLFLKAEQGWQAGVSGYFNMREFLTNAFLMLICRQSSYQLSALAGSVNFCCRLKCRHTLLTAAWAFVLRTAHDMQLNSVNQLGSQLFLPDQGSAWVPFVDFEQKFSKVLVIAAVKSGHHACM